MVLGRIWSVPLCPDKIHQNMEILLGVTDPLITFTTLKDRVTELLFNRWSSHVITQSLSDRNFTGSLLGPKGSPNHKICPLPDQQGALVRTAGERMEK